MTQEKIHGEPQDETIASEPTAAQAVREMIDGEEPFTEAHGDPITPDWAREYNERADQDEGEANEPEPSDAVATLQRELAIAQAHAQFLGSIVRALLDRLYGGKVANGELPADQLMPRIQAELEGINATLNRLTDEHRFAEVEQ